MLSYTPQQLAAFGLSQGATPPYSLTLQLQSLAPTAPPSTLPSQLPSLNVLSPPHPRQQAGPIPRQQQANRRSSRGGGGGGGCYFGGGARSSSDEEDIPPLAATPIPADSEDHDAPEPDASGLYYRVRRGGEVDFGSSRGRVFRFHLKSLIHSSYQFSFEKFDNNDPALLEYIHSTMHARFPNPYGDRFSKEWLTTYVAKFLKNKKSTIRRAVKEQLRYPG